MKNPVEENSIAEVRYYWYRCLICSCNFSIESRGCPRCKKITRVKVISSPNPKPFTALQEECYKCNKYNREGSKGIKCNEFGKGFCDRPMCEGCICSDCCKLEYNLREHPKDHENIQGLQKLIDESIKNINKLSL